MLPIVAIATPFVKDLFANGLSLLGNAIMAKGKDKIEETLGVKLPAGDAPLTTKQLEDLRELQFAHEDRLLELSVRKEEIKLEGDKAAQEAVTKRWEADMLSDSWFSKNIRPLALLHMLIVLDVLIIAAMFDVTIPEIYMTLVGSLLTTMVLAYFVSRGAEKGIDIYQGWKQTRGE